MSKFLAPIHFWLFNKIKIHEELEAEIVSGFTNKYGDDILEIEKQNVKEYGERIPEVSLENIIDEGNIHGWLQQRINIAETRQAAILGELFKKYGDEGFNLAKEIYIENAKKHGTQASNSIDISTADDVFRTINNYILDGMPCDNVNSIIISEADLFEYEKNECLHIGYWNAVGVEPKLMYELREVWVSAFVSALDPNFVYQVDGEVHKIYKVS